MIKAITSKTTCKSNRVSIWPSISKIFHKKTEIETINQLVRALCNLPPIEKLSSNQRKRIFTTNIIIKLR